MPALSEYNCSWIETACETAVWLVDVGFCEELSDF